MADLVDGRSLHLLCFAMGQLKAAGFVRTFEAEIGEVVRVALAVVVVS
jgi:hypothetical protein